MTLNSILVHLGHVWDRKDATVKVAWPEMEDTLVSILKLTEGDDTLKVKLCKECIDAYTRRGHFR